jgi:hypothetical protein
VSDSEGAALGERSMDDRAVELRRAVNSSRARLLEQRRQAEALIAELDALRADADARSTALEEAVSDSARGGAASPAADKSGRARLAVFFAAPQLSVPSPQAASPAPMRAMPARPPLPAFTPVPARAEDEGDGAQQALLLASAWRDPRDGRTLDERLGDPVDLPGAAAAWDAERTGEKTYLVTRHSPDGETDELNVDLETNRVSSAGSTWRPAPQYAATSGVSGVSFAP